MRYSDTSHIFTLDFSRHAKKDRFGISEASMHHFQAKNDSGLDLSRRGLKTWPVELFNLRQLESLDLSLGISDDLGVL